jgi:hypothetical protein
MPDMPRAPLDVEMVWLAHMIRTKHYREVHLFATAHRTHTTAHARRFADC